jgi:hypothetical protein
MYNKILDWAHFAHRLFEYNIPMAIEYRKSCSHFYQNESSFRKHFTYSESCKQVKLRFSLVAVDSLAAPASSQFGAPPFLPGGPLSCHSLPEPSGSVEDGDNFDSSIPPPDDCHMASHDDTYAFDYPYGNELSSTSLPIEHHPDFSNVGAHLELGKESDSTVSSINNNDNDDHGIHHGAHDDHFSASPFHVDDLPAGSYAFSGFVQPSLPYDVHVINDSQLQPTTNEALLSLIIDNNLPQEMYNKMLDWAHFAHLSEYNITMAIEYCTSLHRMHSKYANVCGGPPLSEIV